MGDYLRAGVEYGGREMTIDDVPYDTRYFSLHEDGTLGISDGMRYIDTLSEAKTRDLYAALHKHFSTASKGIDR